MKARSLQDLGALRQALADAQREAQRREALRQAEIARARREAELFRRTVEAQLGPVKPLPGPVATPPPRPRPAPLPRQRERDEAQVLRDAVSDDFDVDTLLETDEALSFRRPGIGPDVVRKLRRGGWSIQRQVDLHGMRREEAREALADFLREAVKAGLRCVRVVHGKGLGSPGREPVLKAKVRSWLVQKEDVLAFTQARGDEGGAGALIVLLRPSRPRD